MGGIAGIFHTDGLVFRSGSNSVIRRMGNCISHRGSNEGEFYKDNMLYSVVYDNDIYGDNRKGVFNEDKSIMLIMDGEVNEDKSLRNLLKEEHCFRTKSTIEIILHLYEEIGTELFLHLNGIFSLAIWDIRHQHLILACDHLGVKPLFYFFDGEFFIFASEIKALLAHPACPCDFDWESALTYSLIHSTIFNEVPSFFKRIKKIKGGNFVTINARNREVDNTQFWNIKFPSDESSLKDVRTKSEIINGYREILQKSISKCLKGETEIGLFLSGGIDSVSVAAFAAEEKKL